MPVQKGNAAIKDGSLPKTVQSLMEQLKPECAYFYPEGGKRAAIMVFDLADPTGMVTVLEPLFQNLDAEISLTPVMDAGDLEAGLKQLGG
jgi:hypothetical protein